MEKSKVWRAPGRPWELDFLMVILLIAGLVAPFYFGNMEAPVPTEAPTVESQLSFVKTTATRGEAAILTWLGAALLIYVGVQVIAGMTTNAISTPYPFLFGPTLLAMVVFLGLADYAKPVYAPLAWINDRSILQLGVICVAGLVLTTGGVLIMLLV